MRFFARFQTMGRSLFRRPQVEQDLDDEMRDHFEHEIESGIESGLSPKKPAALRSEYSAPSISSKTNP